MVFALAIENGVKELHMREVMEFVNKLSNAESSRSLDISRRSA